MDKCTWTGPPIDIRYSTDLRDTRGNPAHAATYIRQRLIVLDPELKARPTEHARILTHERLHFAWVRLSNATRWSWEEVLKWELQLRARGEAGWSAEWRKRALSRQDVATRTARWREYCCESFCDTGAWLVTGETTELTLAASRRGTRRRWFSQLLTQPLPI